MNPSTSIPTPAIDSESAPTTRRSRMEGLLLLTAGALLAGAAWAWMNGPLAALRGSPAIADVAVTGADHGLLTSDGGGDDVLIVLDQRSESLLLYRPQNGRAVDFRGRFNLRDIFIEARATNGIVPMPEPERNPESTPSPRTPGPAQNPDNPPR